VTGRARRVIGGALVGGIAIGAGLGLVHAALSLSIWHTSGLDSETLLFASRAVLILAIGGCSLLICPALLSLCFRRTRRGAIVALSALVPIGLGGVCGLHVDQELARRRQSRVVERGALIVQAIARFEADRGRPPLGLHELVPKYLDGIPPTGLVAHPQFEYRAGTPTGRWRLSARVEDLRPVYLCLEPRVPAGVPPAADASAWSMDAEGGCVPGAGPRHPS